MILNHKISTKNALPARSFVVYADKTDNYKQRGIIELVYIVLQSVVKPGITGFFKIDLHIKCYIYLS